MLTFSSSVTANSSKFSIALASPPLLLKRYSFASSSMLNEICSLILLSNSSKSPLLSGLNSKSIERLLMPELSVKKGFSVLAPITRAL